MEGASKREMFRASLEMAANKAMKRHSSSEKKPKRYELFRSDLRKGKFTPTKDEIEAVDLPFPLSFEEEQLFDSPVTPQRTLRKSPQSKLSPDRESAVRSKIAKYRENILKSCFIFAEKNRRRIAEMEDVGPVSKDNVFRRLVLFTDSDNQRKELINKIVAIKEEIKKQEEINIELNNHIYYLEKAYTRLLQDTRLLSRYDELDEKATKLKNAVNYTPRKSLDAVDRFFRN